MMKLNPFLISDAYKISHPRQYPPGTQFVNSNVTARGSRMEGVNEITVFGLQYFIKEYLITNFEDNFFARDKQEVLDELTEYFDEYFGPGSVDVSIFGELHDLGYLPLRIKALPEGTQCPLRVAFCTIENTLPQFYWLTNFVETLSQTAVWNMITSATIAHRYRVLLDFWAKETGDEDFVPFQGHNFSMRGMSSVESGICTDAGHLLSFVGSDTLPGKKFLEYYYGATKEDGLISCSVPATEHAVSCTNSAHFAEEVESYEESEKGLITSVTMKSGEKILL